MPALRSHAFSTKAAAIAASLVLMVSGGFAQQNAGAKPLPEAPTNQAVMQNYVAPKPVLSVIGPYTSREVPPVNLINSPRLESLAKDGVIMLSMSDAITIALQDNLDIDIARYNLPIANTDILRTKGGGQPLGVATGRGVRHAGRHRNRGVRGRADLYGQQRGRHHGGHGRRGRGHIRAGSVVPRRRTGGATVRSGGDRKFSDPAGALSAGKHFDGAVGGVAK